MKRGLKADKIKKAPATETIQAKCLFFYQDLTENTAALNYQLAVLSEPAHNLF